MRFLERSLSVFLTNDRPIGHINVGVEANYRSAVYSGLCAGFLNIHDGCLSRFAIPKPNDHKDLVWDKIKKTPEINPKAAADGYAAFNLVIGDEPFAVELVHEVMV